MNDPRLVSKGDVSNAALTGEQVAIFWRVVHGVEWPSPEEMRNLGRGFRSVLGPPVMRRIVSRPDGDGRRVVELDDGDV